jgi:hypothetical protein
MDSQIQIGQGVQKTERYFRDVFQLGLRYDIFCGSRKQKFVALSTAKAEYIAASEACTEVVWLRKLIFGLFDQVPDSTIIYCDNQSCIRLSEHPVFHERSKHIEIKYYFIGDKLREGEVKLQYIPTNEQTTNILTKPLSRIKFSYLGDKLGIVEITPLVEREEMALQVGREH